MVGEHVKRCSGYYNILYYTGNGNQYEEMRMNTFVDIAVPKIAREAEVKISDDDLKLLRDYKARYLQGVRQNSVQ